MLGWRFPRDYCVGGCVQTMFQYQVLNVSKQIVYDSGVVNSSQSHGHVVAVSLDVDHVYYWHVMATLRDITSGVEMPSNWSKLAMLVVVPSDDIWTQLSTPLWVPRARFASSISTASKLDSYMRIRHVENIPNATDYVAAVAYATASTMGNDRLLGPVCMAVQINYVRWLQIILEWGSSRCWPWKI